MAVSYSYIPQDFFTDLVRDNRLGGRCTAVFYGRKLRLGNRDGLEIHWQHNIFTPSSSEQCNIIALIIQYYVQ